MLKSRWKPLKRYKSKGTKKLDAKIAICNHCLKEIRLEEPLNIEQKLRYRCESCVLNRG